MVSGSCGYIGLGLGLVLGLGTYTSADTHDRTDMQDRADTQDTADMQGPSLVKLISLPIQIHATSRSANGNMSTFLISIAGFKFGVFIDHQSTKSTTDCHTSHCSSSLLS